MKGPLVIDSSVIVASLLAGEKTHLNAKQLLAPARERKAAFLAPLSVLVEVTAAVARRTGGAELADEVRDTLLGHPFFTFYELSRSRALSASQIASRCRVAGMDALVIQVAQEFKAPLVTLDQEMARRAQTLILVKELDKVLLD